MGERDEYVILAFYLKRQTGESGGENTSDDRTGCFVRRHLIPLREKTAPLALALFFASSDGLARGEYF